MPIKPQLEIVNQTNGDVCCTPLSQHGLSETDANQLAKVLKALADPARLRILNLLKSGGGECCACDLPNSLGLKQPTISHHLKVLFEADLVRKRRRGTWIFYRVNDMTLSRVRDLLT